MKNITILLSIVYVVCLSSCGILKRTTISEVSVSSDTLISIRQKTDSVYIRDSVIIREKGDTVFIFKDRFRTAYKTKIDTILKVHSDTVRVKDIVMQEVKKPMNNLERLLLFSGAAFWVIIIVVISLKLRNHFG